MHEQQQSSTSDAWRIASDLNYCLAKVVGKFVAYPEVDRVAFRRVHRAIRKGLTENAGMRNAGMRAPATRRSVAGSGAPIEDFCQELRGVVACPLAELLRPSGADPVDTRLAAIVQVVREHTRLTDEIFADLIQGVLSWREEDREVILETLSGIIQG